MTELIGQPYAMEVLRNYLRDGHVSGTFLFVGPQHVGKTTAAFEFAKAMLCDRADGGMDCAGSCASCKAIDAGKHPDVRSVRPAGPSRILRIPQIWPRDGVKDFPPESALLHDLHFAPVRGRRRVFIIEDADALNDDTANSLLKVLEEPPPYATLILTAPSPSSVLPTVFSRSQTLRFQSVSPMAIEKALQGRYSVPAAEARFFAALSQGRIGSAIAMARDMEIRTVRDTVLAVAERLSATQSPLHALKLADDLRKAGSKLAGSISDSSDGDTGARRSSVMALEVLATWYRDLLAYTAAGESEFLINLDRIERIAAIAAKHSTAGLMAAIDLILAVRQCVERNANAQIAFEAMCLRLTTLRDGSHANPAHA
jgi:DNA polymerase-3 subunit delta'